MQVFKNRNIRLFIYGVSLLFSTSVIHAQGNRIDSLENLLNSFTDTSRISVLDKLVWAYRGIDVEKSIEFAQQGILICDENDRSKEKAEFISKWGCMEMRKGDFRSALERFQTASTLQNKINDSAGVAKVYGYMGDCYSYLGIRDSSNLFIEKAIGISRRNGFKKILGGTLTNYSISKMEEGNNEAGLQLLLEAFSIFEELQEKEALSIVTMNIAALYNGMKNLEQAKEYMIKGMELKKELDDKKGLSFCYANLATIILQEKDTVKALTYLENAEKLSSDINDVYGLSNIYTLLGVIYRGKNNTDKSLEYDLKALEMRLQMMDKSGLAETYLRLGITYRLRNEFKKSLDCLENSLQLSKEAGLYSQENQVYRELASTLYFSGKYKEAYDYYDRFYLMRDSILNENSQKEFTEMQTKYESEKKEKEIEVANLLLDKNRQELEKQRVISISVVGGLFIVMIFSIVLLRLFRQKKKAYIQLNLQNAEIINKNEEILAQRDEIEAQRDEITKHRDLILEQKGEIEDSIRYARRIQQAVIPDADILKKELGNYFILFMPKDVVSGDFYWFAKVNEWTIVAAADCTGHGVPGAFMSMLGISFLNEIVRNKEVTKASQVLNELRAKIVDALQQKNVSGEQRDGMDISLCVWRKDESTGAYNIQWSGANNALYIIKNNGLYEDKLQALSEIGLSDESTILYSYQEFECSLLEIRPDKMPVAIFDRMHEFTNHEFKLLSGDKIYLFTDGYSDQFGGPSGKKLKYNSFRKILAKNSSESMAKQKEILFYEMTDWMKDKDKPINTASLQVDDITVLGMEFI